MKAETIIGSGKRTVLFRVIVCLGIIGLGIVSMKTLADMKIPPAEKTKTETALQVETIPARFENVSTWLTGFGEVKTLNVVTLSPETSGKTIMVHPRLEKGEFIPKGEILFKVDTRNDTLAIKTSRKRLKALQRNQELVKIEYERSKKLFRINRIGTLSNVEQAEQAVNSLNDQIGQIEQSLRSAQINLQRAVVRAPFDARIKSVSLEKGQYVTPGFKAVTLADDSVLEIHVAVDSGKAMQLLQFESGNPNDSRTRFANLKQVPSRVTWTQGNGNVQVEGLLHRILEFDVVTRTLKLAVRVRAGTVLYHKTPHFPMVEGMFCKVEIPGKIMSRVIRLPRQAVNPDSSVYIVSQNRLKTVPVVIGNMDSDVALVTSGLKPDDRIIVTRLVAPLENTLVDPLERKQIVQTTRR